VSPARSGSTLLRYLLDSHPDIVSPPELNLSALLQHLVEVWSGTDIALGKTRIRAGASPPPPSEEAYRRARKAVDQVMLTCANAAGAAVYCDKSLTTVDQLQTVTKCYPNAPLIFLYRYPLDVIASGLEASRWGFNAFGFQPYVNAVPGNFVAALANFWIDKVSRMLEFERSFEGAQARIYYELLCDDPADALSGLFALLGVPDDETVIERTFSSEHGHGPGDYKIDFTGSISVESIGRGSALPEHLAPQQVERINELLAELDYPELAAAWRGDLAALLGMKQAKKPTADGRRIAERVVALLSQPGESGPVAAHRDAMPFELVIARAGRGEPGRVLIDAQAGAALLNGVPQPDELRRPRVRCLGDVVLRVAGGEITFGKAVHDGEIRVENESVADREDDDRRPHEVLAALAALIRAHA
jgi:Sulfotransferase family